MNPGGPRGRLIDGRFELLERLGGGGMGLVWRARDTALDREVALKEVRPPDLAEEAADPEGARLMRERVLREARALARLQHPNVATIHHIVDTPAHPYPWLVMELVTGGSLADRLNRGPLTVAEAARVGRGVLSALRAAHAAGIQHRDVKPGNVLLRAVGAAHGGGPDVGVPVLTDFGIAAVRDSTALTATGALIGSPEYIAPERIRGIEGDPSSDLWSLGMLLYVAVEGHHPLRRATALATLAAVLDEPLPPPERSGALGPLLSALLAKDPATRPDADLIDQALASAEYAAGPVAPPVFPAPPYYGDSSSTGTADFAPPYPAPAGTPSTGTPYPPPHGTPSTGTPYSAPPYYGGGQPGPASPGSGPQGYGSQGQTPPGHIPSAYGPPSYGTPPPGTPSDRRPTPVPGAGPMPVPVPARRRSGRVALAVVSSTTTIALVSFGVWQLLPGKGNDAAHAGSGTPSVSSAGPGPLASRGTPSASAADPATGGSGAGDAPSGSLLTPAGVRAVVKAMAPYMLGSKVTEFTVYDDHATAEVQTRADPKNLDDLTYRDGAVTHEPDEGLDPDDTLVDLDDFDWDVIPQLLTKARQTLKVPHPTLRYIIVKPDLFDESPVFAVYLTDDYDGGYLEATPQGKVKEINPKGS